MFKKYFAIMLVVVTILVMFTGCAKVVSTEEYKATVTVVDVHYTPVRIYPVKVGKVNMMQTIPADYDVTVEYNGVEYDLDSASAYNIAKENVGKIVMANIKKTRYDDGTVKFSVSGLVKGD